MKSILLAILILISSNTLAQSIPSYWMNYGTEIRNYHVKDYEKISQIDVKTIYYYRDGGSSNDIEKITFTSPTKLKVEKILFQIVSWIWIACPESSSQ